MKRIVLAVAVLTTLIWSTNTWADIGIGLKTGVNFSHPYSNRPTIKTESRMGLMGGLALTFPMSPTDAIMLRAEGMYEARDWREKGTSLRGSAVNWERTVKTNELVFAPFLVMRFIPHTTTPFLEVGPEVGVTLSHEAENTISDASRLSELQDIHYWGRTNVGLNFGGGFVFPTGGGELLLEARYNLGLTDYDLSDDNVSARTRGFQALLGYNFTTPSMGVNKKKHHDKDADKDIDIQIQNKNENEDND